MQLPNETIFNFYEGLNPDQYSDLTGYNLNRAVNQLKENIEVIVSDYNQFQLTNKSYIDSNITASHDSVISLLRSEVANQKNELISLINRKVLTDVPQNAVFTDTVTSITSDENISDPDIVPSTEITTNLQSRIENVGENLTDFKISNGTDLANMRIDLGNLQTILNSDAVDNINSIDDLSNRVETNRAKIATYDNKVSILDNSVIKINTLENKVQILENNQGNIDLTGIYNDIDKITLDVDSNKTSIDTLTSNVSSLTTSLNNTNINVDTLETTVNKNKADISQHADKISDLEISNGFINNNFQLYTLKTETQLLDDKVAVNTSDITTLEADVSSKVSQSEYDAKMSLLDLNISTVVTIDDLNQKADLTELNDYVKITDLPTNTITTADLELKADKADLDLKANLTDLDAYAKTVDLTQYVDVTALSSYVEIVRYEDDQLLKANVSDVNTALDLKANVSDVNTALDLKANVSDIVTVSSANETTSGTIKIGFDSTTGTLFITNDGTDIVIWFLLIQKQIFLILYIIQIK